MMTEIYFPKSISPARLDRYLSAGWFRSNCAMFRSDYLCIDRKVARVINIRLRLKDYARRRSHRRIVKRVEKRFTYEVKRAEFSSEKQRLYHLTRGRFKGFVIDKLELFLYGSHGKGAIFDTHELAVYDGERLVAVSFFDCGSSSIASILAIYDPDYSEYRLGTYTMVKEIDYALKRGYKYYYPGYVLDSVRSFDYKLSAGPMQVKVENKRWINLDSKGGEGEILQESKETRRLLEGYERIESFLKGIGVEYSRYLNPFFSMGYVSYYFDRFICSLVAILIPTKDERYKLLFEYNSEAELYTLFLVVKTDAYDELKNMQDYSYFDNDECYLTELYLYREFLHCDSELDSFADFFS